MISPIQRMTSAFSSAGDRSSRFPGGDMPLQNLKSLYAESPDLPIFTRAVSPCPLQLPPAKPPLPGLLPLLRSWRINHRREPVVAAVERSDLVHQGAQLFEA